MAFLKWFTEVGSYRAGARGRNVLAKRDMSDGSLGSAVISCNNNNVWSTLYVVRCCALLLLDQPFIEIKRVSISIV